MIAPQQREIPGAGIATVDGRTGRVLFFTPKVQEGAKTHLGDMDVPTPFSVNPFDNSIANYGEGATGNGGNGAGNPPAGTSAGTKNTPLGSRVEQLRQYGLENDAQKQATTASVARYDKAYSSINENGFAAREELPQLKMALQMVNDPSFYSGAGANRVLNIRKMMVALGLQAEEGADVIQVFRKFAAGNIMSNMKQLRGLGPIRNSEQKILEQANASDSNNPGAIRAVLEVNQRVLQRAVDVHNMAMDYAQQHGRLDAGFDQQIAKYMEDNPLFRDVEIENYRGLFSREGIKQNTVDKALEEARELKPGKDIPNQPAGPTYDPLTKKWN
jgi:hypothetical protein